MAKRTKRQKAAARHNIKKAQSARRKATKTKHKVNRPKARSKSMAKKRRSSSRRSVSGGFRRAKSGFGNVLKSGVVGKVVTGIGAATVVTLILNRIAPQFAPIGGTAAGFLGGGLIGGAANLILSGGLGNLGGLFGGTAAQGQGDAL